MRITRQTQLFTIATVNAADLPRCGSSPDLKRLKLPLSPPRARPAGAKPTERARRPTFGQFKHCTTISPTIQQPLSNPAPTIGNLNQSSSVLQPPRNREPITTTPHLPYNHIPAARSRQTDDPALGKHPRLNHPSCRIQERFRRNHPTFAILQIRQHRAARPWLVHQLPRPSRHFLHHPRREGNRQAAGNAAMSAAGGEKRKTLEKWAFRGACPSSFVSLNTTAGIYGIIRMFD